MIEENRYQPKRLGKIVASAAFAIMIGFAACSKKDKNPAGPGNSNPAPTRTPTPITSYTATRTYTNTYTRTPTPNPTVPPAPTPPPTVMPTYTPTPLMPTAPTGLSLSDLANNDTDIVATWNANNSAEQTIDYIVLVDGSSYGTSPITTFVANGLTNGVTYNFTIKSRNARGISSPSPSQPGAP